MDYINNYFDKIIFIHCEHRVDRMENIKNVLKKNKNNKLLYIKSNIYT